jgi:hypothetical protein
LKLTCNILNKLANISVARHLPVFITCSFHERQPATSKEVCKNNATLKDNFPRK